MLLCLKVDVCCSLGICACSQIKPKRVAGEKVGQKVDDYWEVGKAQLQDPAKFLDSLFKYEKVCLPSYTIKHLCYLHRHTQSCTDTQTRILTQGHTHMQVMVISCMYHYVYCVCNLYVWIILMYVLWC